MYNNKKTMVIFMLSSIDKQLRVALSRNSLLVLISNPILFIAVLYYGSWWRTFSEASIWMLLVFLVVFIFAVTISVYCCLEILRRFKSSKK